MASRKLGEEREIRRCLDAERGYPHQAGKLERGRSNGGDKNSGGSGVQLSGFCLV